MIYAMSDLHLPSTYGKTMDVFGWGDHVKKMEEQWPLTDDDTIVIPGDLSWGLKKKDVEPDIAWLSSMPGRKILLKGNHDLWWSTNANVKEVIGEISNISYVQNNSLVIEGVSICGTRGWDIVNREDEKILHREQGRLRMSLDAAEMDNIIAFMHYPPLLENLVYDEFHQIFLSYGVKKVYYGHLHGEAYKYGFQGERDGISYNLISADYLGFKPIVVL